MTSARLTLAPLQSAAQTAAEMARLVKTYSGDIGEKRKWPMVRFFDYVKKLPYRADPPGNETISRPALTMRDEWPARDCDDKAILMASWLHENGKPWRFVASSTRPDKTLHHVYLVTQNPDGKEIVLDATYPHNQFGETPAAARQTRRVYLNGWQNMDVLSTFEGDQLGFSIGKSLKKVGKAATKTVSKAAAVTKKAAVQTKRGNLLTATKTLAKGAAAPVKKAAVQNIRNVTKAAAVTKKAAVQAKSGNLLTAGKTLAKGAAAPVKVAADVLARNMPSVIKNKIKALVVKMAGGKVTAATKAVMVPTVTAAALALPGVQPFAPAVGLVVNMALDELIAAGKNKVSSVVDSAKKKALTIATKTVSTSVAMPKTTDSAQARAAAIRDRLQAAQTAQAAQPVQTQVQSIATEANSGMSTGTKIAIAGGLAAVGLLAIAGRKK